MPVFGIIQLHYIVFNGIMRALEKYRAFSFREMIKLSFTSFQVLYCNEKSETILRWAFEDDYKKLKWKCNKQILISILIICSLNLSVCVGTKAKNNDKY